MKVDLPKPLVVLAVKNEGGMRAIAPQYWEVKDGVRPASVWVSAPDQHYLAIRTNLSTRDDVMVNPHISAYFSYANLVLAASFGSRPPAWLSRGLSGVLSNTLVRQDDVVALAEYGTPFGCAVSAGTVHGVQFHPEKSHHFGTRLLQNFAEL